MKVALEEFVPYDKSVRWRLHDAYFAACGGAAWANGDIPSFASSNYGIAHQHAQLLLALVAELEKAKKLKPRELVYLLEVGCGSGRFAANFLRALSTGFGEEGRRQARRFKFVMTDYAAASVRDATAGRELKAAIDDGRLIPGLFDLRRPGRPTGLDGKPLKMKFTAVFANYVCCVSPLKIVRVTKGEWFEEYVRVSAEVKAGETPREAGELLASMLANPTTSDLMSKQHAETEWRPAEPETLFTDPLHAKAIRATFGEADSGTLTYPYSFVELLRALSALVVPGGLALVSDYGGVNDEGLRDRDAREPQHYGNAINHGVEFALFDAVCPLLGLSVVRTHEPLRSVHTAAIRFAKRMPASFARAFEASHVACEDGEDLLDLGTAARRLAKQDDNRSAARLYARCVRIDPGNAELRHDLGEVCVNAGQYRLGEEHLLEGLRLDVVEDWDIPFQLGRLCYRQNRFADAVGYYTLSLLREDHPTTRANLGIVYEGLGDRAAALVAYDQALALDPKHGRAKELRDALLANTSPMANVAAPAPVATPVKKATRKKK